MKRIVFGLIIFLLMIPVTKAYECSNSDKERLQKLADNITISLEDQVDSKGKPYFIVTLAGVSDELSIDTEATMTSISIPDGGIGEITYEIKKTGTVYKFIVQGNKNACWFNTLRRFTVNIPYYNNYYNDPVCNDARNYSLCQKWTKADLSYEEFAKKVNDYKSNINKKKEEPGKNNNNNNNNKFTFFTFYKKYYWPAMIGLVTTLTILLFLWVKQNKKNKL